MGVCEGMGGGIGGGACFLDPWRILVLRASATNPPLPSHERVQPGLVVTCNSCGPQARGAHWERGTWLYPEGFQEEVGWSYIQRTGAGGSRPTTEFERNLRGRRASFS